MPDSPVQHLAIVGFGLIGGSIALAVRERWPAVRITAVDRSPVLAHAAGSGTFDRAAAGVDDLGDAALVVLAAPVHQNVRLLASAMAHARPGTVVTDVGGTKRDIVRAARACHPSPAVFVGGHPIGGAERGGFAFARADLFSGRPWILTPDERTPADSAALLDAFVEGLGAKPVEMTVDEHDRLMAFVSHAPQLAASVLMEIVGEAASSQGLRLAGRGLVDTTRLASSPADVWRDVCAANADRIGDALDALIARLQQVRAGLDDVATVDEVFANAARWRAELMKGRE